VSSLSEFIASRPGIPRIESLHIKNFRALRDVEIKNITPLTVLLGPNGSGKSTVFDAFAFLAECFSDGLRRAWERRGRFRQMRSRGSVGSISFELQYRERPKLPIITYQIEIEEQIRGPVVSRERMRWKRGSYGAPFYFLDYRYGEGEVISGEAPDTKDTRVRVPLTAPDVLAVNTLGQLADHPRVQALRDFITGWHLSYLSAQETRTRPEAGAQERLSQTGDNLPNVIQFLKEQHPDRLEEIFTILRRRIPKLQKFTPEITTDGHLLLWLEDAPFEEPVLHRYASDGTLKMLAYLIQLYDPAPPPLIGIEEPENFLHPKLLPELAEECDSAAARTQLLVTTHSPFFIDRLDLGQVRVVYRDDRGYSQIRRVADMPGIGAMIDTGASLGDLWMEGHFDVGDPLSA